MNESPHRIFVSSSEATSVMEEIATLVSEMQSTREMYNSVIDDHTRRLNALLRAESGEQNLSTDFPSLTSYKEWMPRGKVYGAVDVDLTIGKLDNVRKLIQAGDPYYKWSFVENSEKDFAPKGEALSAVKDCQEEPSASAVAQLPSATQTALSVIEQLAQAVTTQFTSAAAQSMESAAEERFVDTVLQQMETAGAHQLEVAAAQRFANAVLQKTESGAVQPLEKGAEERFWNALVHQMEKVATQPVQSTAAERFAVAVLQQWGSTNAQRIASASAHQTALILKQRMDRAAAQQKERAALQPLESAAKPLEVNHSDRQNRAGQIVAWIGAAFLSCTIFTDGSPRITLSLLALAVTISAVVAAFYYRSLKAPSL